VRRAANAGGVGVCTSQQLSDKMVPDRAKFGQITNAD